MPESPSQHRGDQSYHSHVHNFTGYMRRVVAHFADGPAGLRILDIPAGSGLVSQALRGLGHTVVSADINNARDDFVWADMSRDLPFDPDHFDAVVCLEGIEHMISPITLLRELLRVCKPGGQVILSTPNIMNMYSRLQFLCTGTFYMFHPAQLKPPALSDGEDRFHIAPISYHRLRYLAEYLGASVVKIDGDKPKRALLLPIYLLTLGLGKLWTRSLYFGRRFDRYRDRNQEIHRHTHSWAALFSRSLIVVLQKGAKLRFAMRNE